MHVASSKRVLTAVLMLVTVGLLTACLPDDEDRPEFGWVKIDGRLAVYLPVCADDPIRKVEVVAEPAEGETGSGVVVWTVEDPRTEAAKAGLVVVGDDGQFVSVSKSMSGEAPRKLLARTTTVNGRYYSDSYTISDVRDYPAGTASREVVFEVKVNLKTWKHVSYDDIREEFAKRTGGCPHKKRS